MVSSFGNCHRNAALGDGDAIKEIWERWRQPDLQALEARLTEHVIDRFAGSTERFQSLGVCINSPGKTCTTIDTKHSLHIGLHLDNFDRLPIMDREQSRNRVSVNLGRGDRWLYFGATTLIAMARASSAPPAESHQSVIKIFFRRHPEQPIFRVRIAPGEVYIAPSENIVHDGYTIGNPHPDISFTFLGDFQD